MIVPFAFLPFFLAGRILVWSLCSFLLTLQERALVEVLLINTSGSHLLLKEASVVCCPEVNGYRLEAACDSKQRQDNSVVVA